MAEQERKKGGFSKVTKQEEQVVGQSSLPPSGLDALAKLDAATGSARVVHGAKDETMDQIVGRTVGELRKSIKDIYNIPNDATALIDGVQVDDNAIITKDSTIEFIKQAGVKG